MNEKFKSFLGDLALGALVAAAVTWLNVTRGYSFLHCLCDGFFVSAVLLLGLGGLRGVRNKGAFDIAGYGLNTAVRIAFPFLHGKEDADVYEYSQRKAEKRKGAGGLLAAGTVYLVLSIIVLAMYYAVRS